MRGRKYNRVIEFWQVTQTPDGYGGNIVGDELIARSWCDITTANNSKTLSYLDNIGITDITNTIIVKLRHRNDINYNGINQYLIYKNNKYIIKGVLNIDLNDVDIQIVATKEQTNEVTVISPINV